VGKVSRASLRTATLDYADDVTSGTLFDGKHSYKDVFCRCERMRDAGKDVESSQDDTWELSPPALSGKAQR
jgi:hypothetical protein